jgi:hypothetical protein
VVATETADQGGESSGPGTENIEVHGHWTIEVRNPDGQTAEYLEFENLYTPVSNFLPRVLSREYTLGSYIVRLSGPEDPCLNGSGERFACYVVEPEFPLMSSYNHHNLTVGIQDHSVVLNGHAIAQIDGPINEVATLNSLCEGDTTPSAVCVTEAHGGSWFTEKSLADPISIVEGQQVLVTVELSFY